VFGNPPTDTSEVNIEKEQKKNFKIIIRTYLSPVPEYVSITILLLIIAKDNMQEIILEITTYVRTA
jgi:hypothetical protein